MTTRIREACLDENNQPNEVARRIQARFDADPKGCKQKVAGARCGGKLAFTFDGTYPIVVCSRYARHEQDACELQFDQFIKTELERFDREEAVAYPARVAAAAARNAAAAAAAAAAFGKRKADEEAGVLGLAAADPIARPKGAAPAGQTWSYRLGEWVAEDHFKKKRRKVQAEPEYTPGPKPEPEPATATNTAACAQT